VLQRIAASPVEGSTGDVENKTEKARKKKDAANHPVAHKPTVPQTAVQDVEAGAPERADNLSPSNAEHVASPTSLVSEAASRAAYNRVLFCMTRKIARQRVDE